MWFDIYQRELNKIPKLAPWFDAAVRVFKGLRCCNC